MQFTASDTLLKQVPVPPAARQLYDNMGISKPMPLTLFLEIQLIHAPLSAPAITQPLLLGVSAIILINISAFLRVDPAVGSTALFITPITLICTLMMR